MFAVVLLNSLMVTKVLDPLKSAFSTGPRAAISILVLVIAWVLLGYVFRAISGEHSNQNELISLTQSKPQVLIQVIEASRYDRKITLLGETRYSRRVILNALSEGTVKHVSPHEGVRLSKSSVILKLDEREARAQFNHAKALEEQRQLEYDGAQKLFKEELISAAKLAEARSNFESAKAKRIQNEIELENTDVSLPFDGILQKILVEEGDYVREGQELAEVLDFSPFIIKGQVSEKDAVFIQQGQKAEASLIDGSTYHGKISYKSKQADSSSRSFDVELLVENKEHASILSGVSSTISVSVKHEKAHKLPSSILEIDKQGQFGVKLINEDNAVSFQNIQVLKSDEDGVWIDGLPDVARVIVRGQGFVKQGDIIEPVFAQANTEAKSKPSPETNAQLSNP